MIYHTWDVTNDPFVGLTEKIPGYVCSEFGTRPNKQNIFHPDRTQHNPSVIWYNAAQRLERYPNAMKHKRR